MTYHFESIAVYAELGGALRLASGARAFTTDPTTGAPVDATQGARVAPYVDADASGDVTFTAESWPVRLTCGTVYEDVSPVEAPQTMRDAVTAAEVAQAAAEAAEAGATAPTDAVMAAKVADAASLTRAALNARYLDSTVASSTYGRRNVVNGLNSAAINAAATAAGAGGTIFIPRGPAASPLVYTLDTAITLTDVSIESDGAVLNVTTDFGTGVAAITVTGSGSYPGAVYQGFSLLATNTAYTAGNSPRNGNGITINGNAQPKFRDVTVRFFRSGFVLNNIVGHIWFDHCAASGNYYGVYCTLRNSDYYFQHCLINGNTFANFATPANQGFSGMVVRDSHVGFAPYGVYQEATPANQGANKVFLQTVTFDHARFEAIGNAAIFTDAQQDASNFSIAGSLRTFDAGFSWDAGTYRIAARNHDYAVVLSQTGQELEFRNGSYPFAAGAVNAFHIKAANHSSLTISDSSNPTAALVTTDTGSPQVFAFSVPVVAGTKPSFSGLTLTTTTGYIEWNGSNVRFGADASSMYADMNAGVFRIRNAAAGYASCLDVNSTQATLPATSSLRTGRAVTGSRPSATTAGNGAMFYDTTLGKPIWSDGTVWRDAAGTAV